MNEKTINLISIFGATFIGLILLSGFLFSNPVADLVEHNPGMDNGPSGSSNTGDEVNFGGTIHFMNEVFDKGDIIEVSSFKIDPADTAHELYEKVCFQLLELFKQYLPKFITKSKIGRSAQNNTTYYKYEKIDDFVKISKELEIEIRAKTFPPFYPKIKIGERIFKILLE